MKAKIFLMLSLIVSCPIQAASVNEVLKQLQLPVGFSISLFAEDLANARSLARGEKGVIFVGTRQQGAVYAVQDTNGDGKADKRYVIATDLYMPNGVAFQNGSLYVAEVNRIIRFDNIIDNLANPPKPVVVFDGLPSDRHHGWKYLRFGPDGKLYSAVGAPCNVCEPDKEIYATLIRLNPDGSDLEILAQGIRNTVGFDWQPGTNTLFFTENGRDLMGDDIPPDELNQWAEPSQHFGFPYCHGGTIADPEFGKQRSCEEFVAPAWQFKAHKAPLGMHFYRGEQFPERFKQQLFVAQHGSWNRSQPHGYRIAMVKFKNGRPVSEHSFISGWLTSSDEVLGRPVDILEMPDGSLLISDDNLGVIYKVEYRK
ncbi:PQQ-dependent sugar dehydrogenase [Methylotuvimicrobium buryatense]|uniref:Sorbosone dehydrogenase family protein n=1 Tax=Methylotuvimicrobium buryatense TaxID=95641 RepID=A0A4P9USS1_METBY|nr:sorbosone dehydrogenase family protein [Methylotuvimicrobium buryatense]QCW82786.1 sorbosone dehydrogenase family protein [Methylotuvimicrobium buryatense]